MTNLLYIIFTFLLLTGCNLKKEKINYFHDNVKSDKAHNELKKELENY